jgi:hypothetical protein
MNQIQKRAISLIEDSAVFSKRIKMTLEFGGFQVVDTNESPSDKV